MFDNISLTEYLIKSWIKVYEKYPSRTIIVTIIIVVSFISGGIISDLNRKAEEAKAIQNQSPSFTQQINELDRTEIGLKNLQDFVTKQKQELKETQDLLSKLEQEREKIEPLLKADRALVDALLEQYYQIQIRKNEENVWKERGIGFIIGVASSLVASILWFVIPQIVRKRQQGTPGK